MPLVPNAKARSSEAEAPHPKAYPKPGLCRVGFRGKGVLGKPGFMFRIGFGARFWYKNRRHYNGLLSPTATFTFSKRERRANSKSKP